MWTSNIQLSCLYLGLQKKVTSYKNLLTRVGYLYISNSLTSLNYILNYPIDSSLIGIFTEEEIIGLELCLLITRTCSIKQEALEILKAQKSWIQWSIKCLLHVAYIDNSRLKLSHFKNGLKLRTVRYLTIIVVKNKKYERILHWNSVKVIDGR